MSKEQTLYAQEKLVVRSELITIDTSDDPGVFINGISWDPLNAGLVRSDNYQGKLGAAGSTNGGFSGTVTDPTQSTAIDGDGFITFGIVFTSAIGGMWCVHIPQFSCTNYDSSKGHVLSFSFPYFPNLSPPLPLPLPRSGTVPGVCGWFEINGTFNNFPSRCQFEGSTINIHTQVVPNTGSVQIANLGPIYLFYFI